MSKFDYTNFARMNADGVTHNTFSSAFRNMRFVVQYNQVITLDTSWEGNAPGLADRYLGDARLWWVILHYNGISDYLNGLVPGMQLRIPDRKALLNYLELSSQQTSADTVRRV